jgi:hypothetical protein
MSRIAALFLICVGCIFSMMGFLGMFVAVMGQQQFGPVPLIIAGAIGTLGAGLLVAGLFTWLFRFSSG